MAEFISPKTLEVINALRRAPNTTNATPIANFAATRTTRNNAALVLVKNSLKRNTPLDATITSYEKVLIGDVISKSFDYVAPTSTNFETGFFVDAERRYSTSMQSPTSGPGKGLGLVGGVAALINGDLSRISK